VLIGSSEVFSAIVCYFIVDHWERKTAIYVTEALSLAIAIPIFIFFSCKEEEQCSLNMQIIQTVGLFFFRFGVTVAYAFFYMIQFEVFPSQIRAMGLQTTAIASYTVIVMVPFIMELSTKLGISIIFTFALSCILVVVCTMKMPETLGVPPPEMIEELKYTHHDIDHKHGHMIKNA
jgi:hypothetical protein